MKLKTVSVTYERKLNLGNYQSATSGITLWADVEDGDDEIDAARLLQKMARELVRAEVGRLAPDLKTRTAVED